MNWRHTSYHKKKENSTSLSAHHLLFSVCVNALLTKIIYLNSLINRRKLETPLNSWPIWISGNLIPFIIVLTYFKDAWLMIMRWVQSDLMHLVVCHYLSKCTQNSINVNCIVRVWNILQIMWRSEIQAICTNWFSFGK